MQVPSQLAGSSQNEGSPPPQRVIIFEIEIHYERAKFLLKYSLKDFD